MTMMDQSERTIPPSLEYLEQVTRAQKTLHAVLWSLLMNATDVDDVLQETNVVLWRKAGEYDATRDFQSWAVGIAHMQVLAFRKRQQRDRKKLLFDETLIATLADEAVQSKNELEPRRLALLDCLKKLPERHREILMWRYTSGGRVNEMAAELGKNAKAVSELLRRIRSMLLECIERTVARESHS